MSKTTYLFILFFLTCTLGFSQDSILLGKEYREDQFYLRLTYNILNHKPQNVVQKGLSAGIHTGFIRDIPLSKDGRFSIGIGLGYAYDKQHTNLLIHPEEASFPIVTVDYNKNKFETHAIEMPIEFRFRTSTASVYKFWRIYVGGKIAYNFSSRSIYRDQETTIKTNPVSYLNHWQYGPQVSIGYSTWNIYVYWNMNPLFEGVPITEEIDPNALKSFKIGLQFYVF